MHYSSDNALRLAEESNKEKCVVFLCQEHELKRELKGYFDAFSKKLTTICAPLRIENGEEHLEHILPAELEPLLILQPNVFRLPHGLVKSKHPTGCFQIDTYSGTERRIKWSMLYDYAFVFHPKFDQIFESAGHPRAVCLPHAVEKTLFKEPGSNEVYEVGWVGNLQGPFYRTRHRYVTSLKGRFLLNEVGRHHSPAEMAAIYKESKVAINISRDDFLPDANLRCFEIMASGALLMTMKPTELSDLGFVEGTHYVSFKTESELHEKVNYFLSHDSERRAIAIAARSLVLEKHTYDSRVETILSVLHADGGRYFSPARHWEKLEVHATYLHFFAKNVMIDPTLKELQAIRGLSQTKALGMAPMVLKAFFRSLQLSIGMRVTLADMGLRRS